MTNEQQEEQKEEEIQEIRFARQALEYAKVCIDFVASDIRRVKSLLKMHDNDPSKKTVKLMRDDLAKTIVFLSDFQQNMGVNDDGEYQSHHEKSGYFSHIKRSQEEIKFSKQALEYAKVCIDFVASDIRRTQSLLKMHDNDPSKKTVKLMRDDLATTIVFLSDFQQNMEMPQDGE